MRTTDEILNSVKLLEQERERLLKLDGGFKAMNPAEFSAAKPVVYLEASLGERESVGVQVPAHIAQELVTRLMGDLARLRRDTLEELVESLKDKAES